MLQISLKCSFVSHFQASIDAQAAKLASERAGGIDLSAPPSVAGSSKGSSKDVDENEDKRLQEMGLLSRKRKSTGTLDNLVVRMPPEAAKAAKEKLAMWAYECCGSVSFNSLTHPAFTEFLYSIGIKTAVDRKYLAGDQLEKSYAEAEAGMSLKLAEEPYYQLSGDSWKRRNVNDGLKLLAGCLNFPDGTSTFGDFHATQGQKEDTAFLVESYQKMLDKFGAEKCLGLIFDGAANCQAAARELEGKYPQMCNPKCQAHCLSLLCKDMFEKDGLGKWIMDTAHSMVVVVSKNNEVKTALHAAQKECYGTIRAIRVGVETRFCTRVLELHDTYESKEAFIALYQNEELREKFVNTRHATNDSKALFWAAPNANFWEELDRWLELLLPICDLVHQIECDKPVLSQIRRLWQRIWENVLSWLEKYRAPPNEALPYAWNPAFGTPPANNLPADKVLLTMSISKRFISSNHPCFALAAILDLRFLSAREEEGMSNTKLTRYVQSCDYILSGSQNGSTRDSRDPSSEMGKAFELAKRMVGVEDADAVVAELELWLEQGTFEDMKRMVRVIENSSWKFIASADDVKMVWRRVLASRYPLLSQLAQRLLSMHATSCSSERLWSQMRWVYGDNRTRLGIEKARKMVFIAGCQRLKRKLADDGDSDGFELMLECILNEDSGLARSEGGDTSFPAVLGPIYII